MCWGLLLQRRTGTGAFGRAGPSLTSAEDDNEEGEVRGGSSSCRAPGGCGTPNCAEEEERHGEDGEQVVDFREEGFYHAAGREGLTGLMEMRGNTSIGCQGVGGGAPHGRRLQGADIGDAMVLKTI